MRSLRMVLLLGLILLLWPALAGAEKLSSLYVQPAGEEGKSARAVEVYKKNSSNYYFFLPAGVDASALQICFEGPQSITLGETSYASGDTTDQLVPGETLVMKWGKERAKLHVMQSENIPALFIATETGSLDAIHESKSVKEPGAALMLLADGSAALDMKLDHIKTRGNASFQYQKKAYQIKLEKKTDVLGMGEDKTWILLSNYIDNSLMRNRIAFNLGLAVGMENTSRSAFVDLYINHQYLGNYLLCEKVEIDEGRIEIFNLEEATEALNDKKLSEYESAGLRAYKAGTSMSWQIPHEPEDITGGYLLELELTYRYDDEPSGFVTKRGQPVVIKSPEYASEAQVDYISTLMQELEDALFATDGVNPDTGKHYSEYIDKDSYVTKFLIEEVLKNYDSNRTSQYFYKPADEQSTLLYAGPPWDFDQAMDNYGAQGPKVYLTSTSSTDFHWFPHAYRIDDFRLSAIETYRERFVPVLRAMLGETEMEGVASIQEEAEMIAASAKMNFTRWGYIKTPERYTKAGATFEKSLEYLQRFLTRRMEALEERWKEE